MDTTSIGAMHRMGVVVHYPPRILNFACGVSGLMLLEWRVLCVSWF